MRGCAHCARGVAADDPGDFCRQPQLGDIRHSNAVHVASGRGETAETARVGAEQGSEMAEQSGTSDGACRGGGIYDVFVKYNKNLHIPEKSTIFAG